MIPIILLHCICLIQYNTHSVCLHESRLVLGDEVAKVDEDIEVAGGDARRIRVARTDRRQQCQSLPVCLLC